MNDFSSKSKVTDDIQGLSVPQKIDYMIDLMHSQNENMQILNEKVDPIIGAYDSVMMGKKVAIGLGTFIIFLSGIGGAVLWLIHLIRSYKPL